IGSDQSVQVAVEVGLRGGHEAAACQGRDGGKGSKPRRGARLNRSRSVYGRKLVGGDRHGHSPLVQVARNARSSAWSRRGGREVTLWRQIAAAGATRLAANDGAVFAAPSRFRLSARCHRR